MAELGLPSEVPTVIRRLPQAPSLRPLPSMLADEDEDDERPFISGAHQHFSTVRVYHLVGDRPCWAFTLTKASAERLIAEGPLESAGATYPDGTPVVPEGVDPFEVEVRCGSCGATWLPRVALRLVAR